MKPFDYNKYLKNNRLLKEIDESNMEEGQRGWDFLVYDMDPVLAGKLIGKAKKLGVSVKVTDTGFAGQWEVRISPSNDKAFKVVFKIIEKMGLEFEESRGIFPGTFEEGEINEDITADMQRMAQFIEMLKEIDRILDETDAQLTNMKQAGSKISADRVIDYVQGQFNKIRSFQ